MKSEALAFEQEARQYAKLGDVQKAELLMNKKKCAEKEASLIYVQLVSLSSDWFVVEKKCNLFLVILVIYHIKKKKKNFLFQFHCLKITFFCSLFDGVEFFCLNEGGMAMLCLILKKKQKT